jgi:hypothetical protein
MAEDPLALPTNAAAPPADPDYDAICAAMMETERGRWFLTEYARRNRQADTRLLLAAIERIEATTRAEQAPFDSGRLRSALAAMAELIARTEAEMAAIKPDAGHGGKDDALPAPRSDLLTAAERVLDIVWALRGREVDATLCDALDAAATEIHAAAERQDLSALRAHKAMEVLHQIEGCIRDLIGTLGAGEPVAAAAADAETGDADVSTAADRDGFEVAPGADGQTEEFQAGDVHSEDVQAEVEATVGEPLGLDPSVPDEPAAEGESLVAVRPLEQEWSPLPAEAAALEAAPDLAAAGPETGGDAALAAEPSEPTMHPEPPRATAEAIALAKSVPAAFVLVQASDVDVTDWPVSVPDAAPPSQSTPPPDSEAQAAITADLAAATILAPATSELVAIVAAAEIPAGPAPQAFAVAAAAAEPLPQPLEPEPSVDRGDRHLGWPAAQAVDEPSIVAQTSAEHSPPPQAAYPAIDDIDFLLAPPPGPAAPPAEAAASPAHSGDDPAELVGSAPKPSAEPDPLTHLLQEIAPAFLPTGVESVSPPSDTAPTADRPAATLATPAPLDASVEASRPAAPQPGATPNDPMAPVRALTKDELIALFS